MESLRGGAHTALGTLCTSACTRICSSRRRPQQHSNANASVAEGSARQRPQAHRAAARQRESIVPKPFDEGGGCLLEPQIIWRGEQAWRNWVENAPPWARSAGNRAIVHQQQQRQPLDDNEALGGGIVSSTRQHRGAALALARTRMTTRRIDYASRWRSPSRRRAGLRVTSRAPQCLRCRSSARQENSKTARKRSRSPPRPLNRRSRPY